MPHNTVDEVSGYARCGLSDTNTWLPQQNKYTAMEDIFLGGSDTCDKCKKYMCENSNSKTEVIQNMQNN